MLFTPNDTKTITKDNTTFAISEVMTENSGTNIHTEYTAPMQEAAANRSCFVLVLHKSDVMYKSR